MTTTRSNTIASVGTTIYESPDGGKTIYARKFGSSDRVLIRTDNAVEEMEQAKKLRDKLLDMAILSKTVPALKEQLDKLETIYLLVKNEND
jgi:hypothetical protein